PGDDTHAHHQRRRHYSEAGCRVPAGEGRIEKPGMGFTFAEFDGGRRAVFHGGGFAEMGWGALHRATADESQLGEDVDGREVEQWEAEQSELRVRLGNRQREWTSGDRARRSMAGVHLLHCAIRGWPTDRRGADESGFGALESEKDRDGSGDDL